MSDAAFELEIAGWPALIVDAAGGICQANSMAANIFGAHRVAAAAPLAGIWSPENPTTVEQFFAKWEQAPVSITTLKFRNDDGGGLAYLTAVSLRSPAGKKQWLLQLLPLAPTLAEAKAATGEPGLMHKQRLDCALQLARTVALDFNNALTSILGHTSLVLSHMEANHPWRNSLLEVEKSAAKAAEIANDLGTFSRQEKEVRVQTARNLNLLLQRSVEFFRQNAGREQPVWRLQLERKLFTAKFEEAKMQQAFLKIIENALQALPADGRITLQTRNLELTEAMQDRNVRLAVGAYVCAEISDNGCGIEPDVLPRIFEPFFTTKGGGHRGLGLAWVYGIVTNHGGSVAVSSQPGVGTSVRVYLPAEKQIVRDHNLASGDLSGHQTILMVDDEDLLLTMGQTILSAYGYRVLTANSGQKALDILAQHGSRIELVITDLVMPAMSGRELVEHIHRLSPTTGVICTSGYVWPSGMENSGTYLQKPFTSQELLLKVKQVLTRE